MTDAISTTRRKQHSGEAGYVAERMNPFFPGRKVVIYVATDQQIDTFGLRFAVVCDTHTTIEGAATIRQARKMMKHPDEFCPGCRQVTPDAGEG